MTVRAAATSRQAETFPRDGDRGGDAVSLTLSLLRAAIDDCGWKHEAIALAIGVSGRYCSRMLDGEKPWTVRHLTKLPRDVEARFVRLYAERCGWIVVERIDDAAASRHLASGLFNLLVPSADRMARVFPPAVMAKAAVK